MYDKHLLTVEAAQITIIKKNCLEPMITRIPLEYVESVTLSQELTLILKDTDPRCLLLISKRVI